MYELSFHAIRPAAECRQTELLLTEPDRGARLLPTAAFTGQTHEAFDRHLGGDNRRGPVSVTLSTLKNATLISHPGLDGVVLSAEDDLVFESCIFTGIDRGEGRFQLPSAGPGTTFLRSVFVAFDAAWTNYFHWLCLTLPRMIALADRWDFRTRFVLPNPSERASRLRFSELVWRQSLDRAGVAPLVTELATGVYRVGTLHMACSTPAAPTELIETKLFRHAVTRLRKVSKYGRLRLPAFRWRGERWPRRLLLSRDGSNVEPRLDHGTRALLDAIARPLGFTPVAADALDFEQQAELFGRSECVIAAHGAGLSNILFGSPKLGVLELNTEMDGDGSLRPWFYLLAQSRGQRYLTLNGTAGQFSELHLREAVRRLL